MRPEQIAVTAEGCRDSIKSNRTASKRALNSESTITYISKFKKNKPPLLIDLYLYEIYLTNRMWELRIRTNKMSHRQFFTFWIFIAMSQLPKNLALHYRMYSHLTSPRLSVLKSNWGTQVVCASGASRRLNLQSAFRRVTDLTLRYVPVQTLRRASYW